MVFVNTGIKKKTTVLVRNIGLRGYEDYVIIDSGASVNVWFAQEYRQQQAKSIANSKPKSQSQQQATEQSQRQAKKQER